MAPGGCKLVINEVCPGKADSDNPDDELIELYNTGGGVCDLKGFVLEYASDSGATVQLVWTGEAGDKVSSGSFFVVGGSKFGGAADATYTMAKLGQNGGGVGLRGPSGDLVDAVAWDNAKASHPFAEGDPTASIPDGSSVARKSDGVDTDDNKNDFAIGPPSAGQAN